jgi:hypothetical protein
MRRKKYVAACLTVEEIQAMVPCPYRRCSAKTNEPCRDNDMCHKSRVLTAFRLKRSLPQPEELSGCVTTKS